MLLKLKKGTHTCAMWALEGRSGSHTTQLLEFYQSVGWVGVWVVVVVAAVAVLVVGRVASGCGRTLNT